MSEAQQSEVQNIQSGDDRIERAQRLLPRRRFLNEMPDKGLFVIVAVGGFAGILLSKLNGANANVVAIAAVVSMLLYGVAAFQIRRVRMRPDRLGDNFYYLGFIYTLASLSAALMQIQINRALSVDYLLGSFGIALFTTIVGVAGRVLFVQMRGDLDDVEEDIRRNLLSTSADLRAQLSSSLAEFETFHTGIAQAADKVAKQSGSLADQTIAGIKTVAIATAENINEAFKSESERVQRLERGLDRIETGMVNLTDDLNERFTDFNKQLSELVTQLTVAVDAIARHKRRRWYWPFSKV
ncbi:hypothetical protein AB8A28_09220 [Tardiphaga sp. 71_E8_N1_1]|uniref:hypothetical protein n=1 Tax=Tardiphaga sp. 71_E8_N1_1 TaxID=3240784 RepID=UPI003F89C0F3